MNILLTWILCVLLLFNNGSNAQKTKQIYLLPETYRGKAVVVYNRPFGDSAKVAHDSIYFSIPADGIAIVKSSIKSRLEQSYFYQIDSVGNMLPLDILSRDLIMKSSDSMNLKNQVGVFIFATIGSCDPKDAESFCYSDFYVGTLNEMSQYYTPKKAEDFEKKMRLKARWQR